MSWAVSTTTKHTCGNGRGPVFGKKTPGCPRCDELIAGAAPVKGWGPTPDERAREMRSRLAHFAHRPEFKGEHQTNPGGYCICGGGGDHS